MDYIEDEFIINYLKQHLNKSEIKYLSDIVTNDIEEIKKQIYEKLKGHDYIDMNDLIKKYNDVIDLNKQINLLENELNQYLKSDLLDRLKQVDSDLNSKIETIINNKLLNEQPLYDSVNYEVKTNDNYISNFENDINEDNENNEEVDETVKEKYYYLLETKKLICEELHNTILINETNSDENSETDSFPLCQISVSILKLVDIIEELFNKKTSSKEESDFYTSIIINICELYINTAVIKHKRLITTLPQQSAIFYNNSMYLAHSLRVFISKYQSNSECLPNYISDFYKTGNDIFIKQMQTQELIILSYIQDPYVLQYLIENANDIHKSNLTNPFEKAIKQCMIHFKKLKTTLEEILPPLVYDKAMGTLMNTFFNEIVQKVSTLDDISADAANHFANMFQFIYNETPKLFIKVNFSSLISKWNKFCELKFLLNAGLIDIVDRWANGYGPLASEFTPEEVKSLIRALFQNTERRALALSKIKLS